MLLLMSLNIKRNKWLHEGQQKSDKFKYRGDKKKTAGCHWVTQPLGDDLFEDQKKLQVGPPGHSWNLWKKVTKDKETDENT